MIRYLVFLCLLLWPAPVVAGGHGAEVLQSQGCRGCHALQGRGATFGPPLDGIGRRLSQERLRQWILAPQTLHPATTMPAYRHLPAADLQALLDYLQGLH